MGCKTFLVSSCPIGTAVFMPVGIFSSCRLTTPRGNTAEVEHGESPSCI